MRKYKSKYNFLYKNTTCPEEEVTYYYSIFMVNHFFTVILFGISKNMSNFQVLGNFYFSVSNKADLHYINFQ